ncbi:class I SAM-dependent methyltransferase [Sansalvadorimonas verongulae]|uniref:class I SAM-dependent methyltransferase n=1 Tax=Sansalvadorimonas verongulae TaxID=2172824 RepID=UPI0012BCEC67|nr:class I SAM-dependent methyltransferase [Sansalvadorimonas verongulae]MTI14212.1 SAM-dependent methyltransferase [Sansalvadorimonas verongulae]
MSEALSPIEHLNEHLHKTALGHDAERLLHGRGGLLAGCEQITVDWYPPVLLFTAFKEIDLSFQEQVVALLGELWRGLWNQSGEMNLVFQQRGQGISKVELISGNVPAHHVVTEDGRKTVVHLMRGQNHGLFLDMRNGRRWTQEHASGRKVLNLFSYTCAFSVAAMKGGASEVVNIDMSKGALAIGRENHRLNDVHSGVRLLGHDIFKSWGKLRKLGPYDLIIADPPSNQKGSFVATKDYARLLRKIPELVSEDGDVLLCLNAPQLPRKFLMDQVEEECPGLVYVKQIANPDVFKDVDADSALKVLHYRKA